MGAATEAKFVVGEVRNGWVGDTPLHPDGFDGLEMPLGVSAPTGTTIRRQGRNS
jgi:hypothetical protein